MEDKYVSYTASLRRHNMPRLSPPQPESDREGGVARRVGKGFISDRSHQFSQQLKSTSHSHQGSFPNTTPNTVHCVSFESPQQTPGQHRAVREISLCTIDPVFTGGTTPPALAPAWDASPEGFPLASSTSAFDSDTPALDLAPGSTTTMSVATDPESRRVHGRSRVDVAATGRWYHDHEPNHFEPYPHDSHDHRPAHTPVRAKELLDREEEEEDKPHVPYQNSHQQPGTAGHQDDLGLQLSGNGSASYTHSSYLCNPPSRAEGRVDANWPSEHLHPHTYMTNAEVCQPLSYDTDPDTVNHGVASEGFGPTPHGYQQHQESMATSQYNQTLAVNDYSTSCVDPSIIGIPHGAYEVPETHIHSASPFSSPHVPFGPENIDFRGSESSGHSQAGSSSSPTASQTVVVPDAHMDITELDNPLPETRHLGWGSSAEQPMVIEELSDRRSDEIDTDTGNATPDEEYTIITKSDFIKGKARRAIPSNSRKEPPKKKKGLPRGPFSDLSKRAETAETRRRRACTRCREQKTRCSIDPDNPNGECQPCKELNRDSKKTIHRAPCQRGKITDAILVRRGGLELTRRWQGTELKDVTDRYYPIDIREIEFTLGTCDEPLKIQVVRFNPIEGDVLDRFWMYRNRRRKLRLPPYCLLDIHATARYFEEYVRRNAISSMRSYACPGLNKPAAWVNSRPMWYWVVERTYEAALNYYDELRGAFDQTLNPVVRQHISRKQKLLWNLFMLRFASRHTTGSSYICGEDTLGMEPHTKDESYPLFGRISLPRMLIAQFDNINHTRFLQKHVTVVLKELEYFINQKSEESWWVIYLTLFILFRETSWLTEDRYRHARNNYGNKIRYSLPAFVEDLQSSCTLLVQYWKYYNTMPMPNPLDPSERHKSAVALPLAEQYNIVAATHMHPIIQQQLTYRTVLKAHNYTIPPEVVASQPCSLVALDWDHPLFWVSQLFEVDWTPHRTYQREPVPGPEGLDLDK